MEFYSLLEFVKSAEFHVMAGAISAGTKYLRSALGNVKGKYALVLHLALSTLVGGFLYADVDGLLLAVVAGFASGIEGALLFRVSKMMGKTKLVDVS